MLQQLPLGTHQALSERFEMESPFSPLHIMQAKNQWAMIRVLDGRAL
jgi:hypothetical protein